MVYNASQESEELCSMHLLPSCSMFLLLGKFCNMCFFGLMSCLCPVLKLSNLFLSDYLLPFFSFHFTSGILSQPQPVFELTFANRFVCVEP